MSKKLLSVGVVLALVAAVLVGVGAQTASAQTMSLCQTVDALVAAGVIASDKVAAAKAAAGCSGALAPVTAPYTFTRNLTIGSTGADVTALQTFLLGNGNNIPAGATGYFGAQTKAALAAYQASKGIAPAVGYFGPLTMASVNAQSSVAPTGPTSTVCPAGMTCTPTVACPAGYTCTSNTGVTTTGTEGSINVTQSNSGLASSVYEGDSQVGVLGLKVEAKSSDMSVQRVKVDLGTSASIYNRVLDKIFAMDGSTVLASADLNSSTVTKESDNHYTITLTGMNMVVAKNTSKTLTIAVDVKSTVDTAYRTGSYLNKVISLYGTDAVRALDGAGLDEYAGTSAITRTFQISGALSDSSTLKTSLSSASPKATTIIASDGANQDEADKVTTLVFNVKATKSDITITDLVATTTGTAVTAGEIVTAYLFDGSTELDNSTVSGAGVSTFNNLTIDVAKDTTKTLTIKVDVRNASTSALAMTSFVNGLPVGITAENVNGDAVGSQSGSATGETLSVQKAGAVYTLVGTPTLSKSVIGNTASSTFLASFTVDVAANGTDLQVASSGAFEIGVWSGNVELDNPTVSYDKPTSGITQSGTGPYVIADGSSARFVVQASFVGPLGNYVPAGAIVSARVDSATSDAGTVTYISDTFRTGSQTL